MIRKIATFALASVASFAVGFGMKDLADGKIPSSETYLSLFRGQSNERVTPTMLFKENYNRIHSDFYRQVDRQKLKFAGMEGLFSALGDPHTNFLEPKVAESFATETRGDFVGVGARLAQDPLGAKVMIVFKGSPADKAGVKVGDVISAVDGESVSGVIVDDIVTKIRGQEGTKVTLKVMRSGQSEPISIPIVRSVVILPTAEGKMLPGNIGYISVTGFSEPTPQQFDQALAELIEAKATGLVIDMRGNLGGLLEVASEMLSRFVSDKTVVTMKGRMGAAETVKTASGRAIAMPGPVAVLINEESASAAEIFAGVLRDYKKATLVGEHSYGKASVQNIFTLVDMASAKITIARYYLPSGDDISRRVDEDDTYISGGLKPDIIVPLKADANTIIGDPEKDSQLMKAVELIKSKRGESVQARNFEGRRGVVRFSISRDC